jgi:hypothetical protein
MANCNSITINSFIPNIRFASYSGFAININKYITKQQWDIYGLTLKYNFFLQMKNPKIIENIKKLFLSLLTGIDEDYLDYCITELELKYDNDKNSLKINTDTMFDYLNSQYEKEDMPLFLKFVNCININFLKHIDNVLNDMLSKIILEEKLINRVQLEDLKNMIDIMLNELAKIVASSDKIKLINDRCRPYIDEINECLDTNKGTEINLETKCNKLYQLMYNDSFTSKLNKKCDILFPGMKEKYDEMLSELKNLLDNFLKDTNNIFSDKLTNIKKRGNSRLGNQGRITLMNTYFKKTNKNTKLSPKIKALIARESNAVISQLKLEDLLNETNA